MGMGICPDTSHTGGLKALFSRIFQKGGESGAQLGEAVKDGIAEVHKGKGEGFTKYTDPITGKVGYDYDKGMAERFLELVGLKDRPGKVVKGDY